MKVKSLQFGKAMSAALFVLLLSVAGMTNAQTQVATLQHGETITAYYGVNALIYAHAAAANGDIITLSSGTFIPTSLIKSITLRGAGVVTDTVAGTHPTIINTLYVYASNCTIEGIKFSSEVYIGNSGSSYTNTKNPRFYKCNIHGIRASENNGSKMTNGQFVNCKISSFNCTNTYNTQIINSVVGSFSNTGNDNFVDVVNSIIKSGSLSAISAMNSIICGTTSNSSTPDYSCTFINCIGIKPGYYDPFGSGFTENCATYTSYANVFESYNGTFSYDESYNLTEAVATGFLGNDDTQVGIYGGYVPYNPRPSYMVIRQCNVARQSTIDNKLSVEIEVVTEGE